MSGFDEAPLPQIGTVLIVEDNMIIALDMEDVVLEMGAKRALLCRTCQDAFDVLAVEDIHFALLDFHLTDETSQNVAQALLAAGKPFLFVTGSSSESSVIVNMEGVPRLQKPFTGHQLRSAVADLLAGRKQEGA